MNLKLQDLGTRLKSGILPVYIVSGDEPLQMGEACDMIRTVLRANDYMEREIMQVDKHFDWSRLAAAASELSLFSSRRILELRMPGGKPGDKGSKALQEYAQRPAEDTVLLVISGKLDKSAQNSKWYKALDSIGAAIAVWPVETKQLPMWLKQRLQAKGLEATPDALALLAERAEGNLLAASQEVEKLVLLHQGGAVDAQAVAYCVTDSARYDVYALVDASLEGQTKRVLRMLEGLRAEGTEPILVLWALSRELRSLHTMAQSVAQGQSIDAVMRQARVWPKRTTFIRKTLQRHNTESCLRMLRTAAAIDRMIKGRETGNVWDELLQLSLMLAGLQLLQPGPV